MSKKDAKKEYRMDIYEESYTARDISNAQKERKARREVETAAANAKREKRRRITRNRRIATALVLIAIIGFLALIGNNVLNLFQLRAEKAAREAELATLENRVGALSEELEQVNSDEYVEQQARSDLHMIRPGETLYIFEQKE